MQIFICVPSLPDSNRLFEVKVEPLLSSEGLHKQMHSKLGRQGRQIESPLYVSVSSFILLSAWEMKASFKRLYFIFRRALKIHRIDLESLSTEVIHWLNCVDCMSLLETWPEVKKEQHDISYLISC